MESVDKEKGIELVNTIQELQYKDYCIEQQLTGKITQLTEKITKLEEEKRWLENRLSGLEYEVREMLFRDENSILSKLINNMTADYVKSYYQKNVSV